MNSSLVGRCSLTVWRFVDVFAQQPTGTKKRAQRANCQQRKYAKQLPHHRAPQSAPEPRLHGHQPRGSRRGPCRLPSDRALRPPRALIRQLLRERRSHPSGHLWHGGRITGPDGTDPDSPEGGNAGAVLADRAARAPQRNHRRRAAGHLVVDRGRALRRQRLLPNVLVSPDSGRARGRSLFARQRCAHGRDGPPTLRHDRRGGAPAPGAAERHVLRLHRDRRGRSSTEYVEHSVRRRCAVPEIRAG